MAAVKLSPIEEIAYMPIRSPIPITHLPKTGFVLRVGAKRWLSVIIFRGNAFHLLVTMAIF